MKKKCRPLRTACKNTQNLTFQWRINLGKLKSSEETTATCKAYSILVFVLKMQHKG